MPPFSDFLMYGLLLICTIAAAYQMVALFACALHLRHRDPPCCDLFPPISILKPVLGREEGFYEAIRSHASQDYPEFEILFGITDPCDPSIPEIRTLQAEFPHVRIELVVLSRLSWKWRKRSAVKIMERTREKAKNALHPGREGRHTEAPFAG
jgi:cellulose synthase/poly-beta-1,6-N-acetylglucosamine synthase-like glycosyltransferase